MLPRLMTGQAFSASCDELGDHISDYSQAAQRGSLILYCGGGEGGGDRNKSFARRTEEMHT